MKKLLLINLTTLLLLTNCVYADDFKDTSIEIEPTINESTIEVHNYYDYHNQKYDLELYTDYQSITFQVGTIDGVITKVYDRALTPIISSAQIKLLNKYLINRRYNEVKNGVIFTCDNHPAWGGCYFKAK